jgi:hypothetical protein
MPGSQLRHTAWQTLHRSGRWTLLAAAVLGACVAETPTTLRAPGEARAGKGPASTGPTVTSVDPAQAPQDTTADVAIYGSGFTTGAKATWALNGDTTQVHVKATRVVNATKLIATIVVPAGAPVASYDIEITLVDGKKGVGVEKFAVTYGDPTAVFAFPLSDAGLGVRSDRKYLSGDASIYAEGICGVHSKIFATNGASGSGDAIMNTEDPAYRNRKCAEYPRMLTVDFGNGTVRTTTVFLNTFQIQNAFYRINVGDTVKRAMGLGGAGCNGLAWRAVLQDGTITGADSVLVTRTSTRTWTVQTQPAPNDKARCAADGQLYHIPVYFTITASRDLP